MSQLYQPLDLGSIQIRLICFEVSDGATPFKCRLERFSIFTAPQYNALSYCWGDENLTTKILVNGQSVRITLNLAAALHRARELNSGQWLWVDALCINQADNHEKNQQVKQMKHIYERAHVTYGHLTGSAMDPSSVLWAIQQATPDRSLTSLVKNVKIPFFKRSDDAQGSSVELADRSSLACQALFEIVQNEYWRRRWIIQELVASKKVQIVDEHHIVALEDLVIALQRYSRTGQWNAQHELASEYFREIMEFRENYLEARTLTLCAAITRTKTYLSKDLRDRIFALIGICSNGQDLVPLPSYHQNSWEIERDLTRRCILQNVNLDLIFKAPVAGPKPASSSSWSPAWLSADLDIKAHEIADAEWIYPRMLAHLALRGDSNVLKVQGITLGVIASKTCQLAWHYMSPPDDSCNCSTVREQGPIPLYYRSREGAAVALRAIFLRNMYQRIESKMSRIFFSRRRSQYFLWELSRGLDYYTRSRHEEEKVYSRWLWNHRKFMVHGAELGFLLARRRVLFMIWLPLLIWLIAVCSAAFALYYFFRPFDQFRGYVLTAMFYGLTVGGLALVALIIALTTIGQMRSVFIPRKRKFMCERLDALSSLIRLDNGSVGMASGNLLTGDLVCFIAGCESQAILRPQPHDQANTFMLVGRCDVRFHKADWKKHRAMLQLLKSGQPFAQIMEKLERNDGWREYDLI